MSTGQLSPRRVVPREMLYASPLESAKLLLNKLVVRGDRVARIVEVEAYGGSEDPASHAFKGPTQRNRSMFGPPGHLYVYFTYGMHWCANVVCGPPGAAGAVLLRAASPVAGTQEMWVARKRARRLEDLLSGPGKFAQAFGITGAFDGADLSSDSGVVSLVEDGTPAPKVPGIGCRVGLTRGRESAWRLWVPGDRNVSPARGASRGAG
ncbi:MAG: DNA-3-methyladenine glycosylase [Acidimicrobiales bacterium]